MSLLLLGAGPGADGGGGAAPTSYQLVADGNSLPAGDLTQTGGDPVSTLHRRLQAAFGRTLVTKTNFAGSGDDIDDMNARAATVDAVLDPTGANVLFLWEHVNQRVGALTALATVKSMFRANAAAHRAAGWHVIVTDNLATGWTTAGLGAAFEAWEVTERQSVDADLADPTAIGDKWDAHADLTADALVDARVVAAASIAAYPHLVIPFPTVGPNNWIHKSEYGYPWVVRVWFPLVCDGFGLSLTATQLSIHNKLLEFFPLYKVAAETTPNSPTLGGWGGHRLTPNGGGTRLTQNDLSVTFDQTSNNAYFEQATHYLRPLTPGGSFGVCAWVKSSVAATGRGMYIASVWNLQGTIFANTPQSAWMLRVNTSNQKFQFVASEDGDGFDFTDVPASAKKATSTVSSGDGNWHFVCGWYDATAGNIYVSVDDETPVATAVSAVHDPDAQFRIASVPGYDGEKWQGELRGVGFFHTPPDATERTYLYNAGVPRDTLFTPPS